MYPLLTAIGGLIMASLSLWRVVRQIMAGDFFLMIPIRFMLSGILLAAHYPLTSHLSQVIHPHLTGLSEGLDTGMLSTWLAIAGLICAQLIVIPTSRDLYVSGMAGVLGMRGR